MIQLKEKNRILFPPFFHKRIILEPFQSAAAAADWYIYIAELNLWMFFFSLSGESKKGICGSIRQVIRHQWPVVIYMSIFPKDTITSSLFICCYFFLSISLTLFLLIFSSPCNTLCLFLPNLVIFGPLFQPLYDVNLNFKKACI